MVIATQLTIGTGSGSSPISTASVSPAAGTLAILAMRNRDNAGGATTPTASGWTQIATHQGTLDTNHRITFFRAMNIASGAAVLDFSGNSQNSVEWAITQFSNVVTSGVNGADAVVQSSWNEANSNALSVTLGAFGKSANATYGFVYQNAFNTITKGSNFTELGNSGDGAGNFESQWANNPQTTVNWTMSGSAYDIGMAIEINEQTAKGAFLYRLL